MAANLANVAFMEMAKLKTFEAVRTFSSAVVALAIVLSIIFSSWLGADSLNWQVAMAVIALAIGIPHGALDHLVTLPKAQPFKMAIFVTIYVVIALAAIWAILQWNVWGFIAVVVMSATHFGIGDSAFISELNRTKGETSSLPVWAYAPAAGLLPVVIPLVNSRSTEALTKVNEALIDWHQGLDQEILYGVSGFALFAIVALFLLHRKRESLDVALLLVLALIAPPLIAFAVYFGCWHAMRHTARLTLTLDSSQRAYASGDARSAFTRAVIPGLPALAGTFLIAGVLAVVDNQFNDDFFWMALVVVWALTVPHMAVTAKLDRSALT